MKATRRFAALALVAVALVAAGCGGDDEEGAGDTVETTTAPAGDGSALQGSVGPGFDISFEADGGSVSTLTAGSYELEVDDLSTAHNFHLTGPGVDVSTGVAEEGTQSFEVDLQPGSYTFVCDPHAGQMQGEFEVTG